MNEMFEPDFDDPYWLDALVDNELSHEERVQLFRYLEASPDGWRRCAMAFVNSQVLAEDLNDSVLALSNVGGVSKFENHEANPIIRVADQQKQSTTNLRFTTFCMSIVLTIMISIGATLIWTAQTQDAFAQRNQSRDSEIVEVVQRIIASQRLHDDQTSNAKTCLIRVLDNEYVSIYETPDLLPSLFLESLVLAGHQVEVQSSELRFHRPMNRIVIKKTNNPEPLL